MAACAEQVQYQLPNEHSRVGFLLEGIQCADPGLQAAMASVKTDNGPNGLRNDFEATAAHLLPYDPVAKKRTAGSKHGAATISSLDTDDANVGSVQLKKSIGRTGVHLRYYKVDEYRKLTPEQKEELREWRKNNPVNSKVKKDKPKGKEAKKIKSQVASLVSKQVEAQLKKMVDEEDSKTEYDEAVISSMIEEALNKKVSATVSTTTSPATKKVTLKSILKKAKNSQE
jgi:hypothetical protein